MINGFFVLILITLYKKTMKKIVTFSMIVITAVMFSSCATVFGGRVSDCQRTKPAAGQPGRELRAAALVCDVLFFLPGAIIDFATGAIYRPCSSNKKAFVPYSPEYLKTLETASK